MHSGARPYTCPIENCGKTFTRRTTLTRHQLHCNKSDVAAEGPDPKTPDNPSFGENPNRQALYEADDLSDGSSSPSSSGRRVSTTSMSTDYNHSVGPDMRSQSASEYWPALQPGTQMPLPDLHQISSGYSNEMAGLSPRASRVEHQQPMASFGQSHSGMELNIQQAKMGGRSPVQHHQAYQSSHIPSQAHYMNYNYPDPRYSPHSQEAYYAMQNLQQQSDTTTNGTRQAGRGSWDNDTQ